MMENENKNVDEIIERLQNGVREIFEGDNFKHYLEVMAKFHTFSSYNWQLIYEQCPNATKLAGYVQWKKDFNRHVRKGEKAIRILAPRFGKGGMRGFKEVCIFDISQTEGEELPDVNVSYKNLQESCSHYKHLYDAFIKISPLPIFFDTLDGCNGICYFGKKIAINKGLSQSQTIETIIHEIAHAILHTNSAADKYTKEVEAESVAYAVCSFFNIDSSDFSFGYVANWSKDKQLDILRSSLETITKTANDIINAVLKCLGENIIEIEADTENEEQRAKELYEIGMSYYKEKKYESAVYYFEQAVDLDNRDAIVKLADCLYHGLGVSADTVRAYELYMSICDDDNGYSYFMLGEICCSGIGDNVDYIEAVYWYKKAAALKYIDALYTLGECYKYGLGVESDEDKAQEYYCEAAILGDVRAKLLLNDEYVYKKAESLLHEKKREEALKYFVLAAEIGNLKANYLLGVFYERNEDWGNAHKYILASAETNNKYAQYIVGFDFRYARGVEVDLKKAIYWFRKSAEQEYEKAQYELADCYWNGIGVDEDRKLATAYYLKAYKQGYYKAGYKLVKCCYYGLDVDKKLIKEFIENHVDIEKADDELLFILGELYFSGKVLKQDYIKAVECLKKSSDEWNYDSCYHLAECYFYGLGIECDLSSAFEYYKVAAFNDNQFRNTAFDKLFDLLLQCYWIDEIDDELIYEITNYAEQDYKKAQLMLGNCYYNGYGVDVDYAEAISWREKAAEQGDAQAQLLVAQQYFSGIGTLRDVEKAKHWYNLAAENGNTEAQYQLAEFFEVGTDGVRKSLSTAFYWYKKAAEADNVDAILKVGQMYDSGIGTGKNVDKAVYWYEKAAKRNYIDAMFALANIYLYNYRDIEKGISTYETILELTRNNKLKALIMTKLGEFYSLGIGVKKDSYKAMYYYRDAVANGSVDAAYLLGNIYLNQKNYTTPKRAIEVFLLGACGGNIACQKKLAELYLKGVVVQKSSENAIRWFAEAAKNGDIDAEVKMLELLQAKNEIQKSDVEQQEQNANCLHSNITEKLSDIFS